MGDPQIGDIVLQPRADPLDADDFPRQRNIETGHAAPRDGHHDRGAGRTAQQFHRFPQRQLRQRTAIGMGQPVSGLQPRAHRRRAVDRRDHLKACRVLLNLDSQATERAVDFLMQFGIARLVQIDGVIVQGMHHPVDGGFDQLRIRRDSGVGIGLAHARLGGEDQCLVFNRPNIICLNALIGLREKAGIGIAGIGRTGTAAAILAHRPFDLAGRVPCLRRGNIRRDGAGRRDGARQAGGDEKFRSALHVEENSRIRHGPPIDPLG